jgi:putative nucleotidyltransferase with HDIG domain
MAEMTARDAAVDVARLLVAAGHRALFAGGCVRDRLLGGVPDDYDVATSATPKEVTEMFPRANLVGAHFGVVIVKHGGHHVEVATFRTDGSYGDSRHPDHVEFSTPEEDAKRRDFTINGLFEDPADGQVIDFVGGLEDLKGRRLRAIGNPESRFREDALRLMRAVRFATRLGFEIETQTREAMSSCAGLLEKIAIERIRDEFSSILTGPNRRRGVELLVDSGLMSHIIPEVFDLIGCEQPPEFHPEGDVYTHTMIMLELLDPAATLDLCLAVLLHDIAKPATRTVDHDTGRPRFNGHDKIGAEMAGAILRRLRYPNEVIEHTVFMVGRHMAFMHVQQMRVAKVRRFMGAPTFQKEMELHRVDCASSNGLTDNYDFLLEKAQSFANEPFLPPPFVTGRDLIQHGLKPGPRFKEILEHIQTEQLEGRVRDRETALEMIDRMKL